MGRKRARTGKLLLLCAAGLTIFPSSSCVQSKSQVTMQGEVQVVDSRSAEPPSPSPALIHLDRAQKLFDQGDFEASRMENQMALSLTGENPPGDRALYNMALISASSVNPKKDLDRCRYLLQRLLHDYPRSPFAREAGIWMNLLQENEQLRKINEKTQPVDLENEPLRKANEKIRQIDLENERLRKALEKIQQVDLEVERKKREKTR
jgi:hypothetical protein